MKKKKVVIIGAGGFGREVLDIIDACNVVEDKIEALGYVIDSQYGKPGNIVNEKPILGDFEWLERYSDEVYVTCGIGSSHLRYQLVQRALNINCRFINLIHPSAIFTRWISIGKGVVIAAGCILTNQIKIGNHVHLNLSCTIGHDVDLQDFVTLSPGVHVSGNTTIETGCYIGTGVNMVEKITISSWSIIGAGSTVVGDIPSNTTVVGVPGKVIKEREPEWYLK